MQLQNFSPEPKRDQMLERIEAKALTPRETAREMLREGDRQVTDTKSTIETVRRGVAASEEDAATRERLTALESELDSAWDDLRMDVQVALAKPETPTEEDLDWEIPEEAPASGMREKKRESLLTPTQLEFPGDAMREILHGTEGLDADNIAELLKTPEGREEARAFMDEQLDLAAGSNVSFDVFERAVAVASRDKELLAQASERLQGTIGKKFAEMIFSTEFRGSLRALSSSLEGRLGEKGPNICADRNLSQLIAIHETMGMAARDMVAVADLQAQAPELAYAMSGSALQVTEVSFDEETGELSSDIILGLEYEMSGTRKTLTDEKTGRQTTRADKATIDRRFYQRPVKGRDGKVAFDAEGNPKTYKRVQHELLAIPPSLQSGGIAKKVTEQSMKQYDRMGLDAMTLHAAKEIGGYAWATYGYGWDQEEMVARQLSLNVSDGKTITDADGREITEYEELSDEKKAELLLEGVKERTTDAKERFFNELGHALTEEEKATYEAAYTELEDSVLTTPQHLLRIGLRTREDGTEVPDPPFFRGASGNYYRNEDFQKAIASGEEQYSPEDRARIKKGKQPIAFQAGKVGMIGKKVGMKVVDGIDWYGKVELKATGQQGGKNRTILEKKLRET